MLELRADPDEGLSGVERLAHDLEERGALLEHLEQPLVGVELLAAQVLQQPGRPAHVEALLLGCECLLEERPDGRQERPLPRAQAGVVVEPSPQAVAAQLEPGGSVVEVFRGPVGEHRVDGLGEAVDPLRDATRGRDHHHHHRVRLQQQHLDMANGRASERRRGDEREQARQLRQHVGRRLQRGVDLAARGTEVQREALRTRIEPLEQAVGVVAIAALGRDPTGRRVRVCQQPAGLELRELGPDRGRGDNQARSRNERARADGLARRDVRLDHAAQDLALALGELDLGRLVHHLCRDFRQTAPP